ncbi:spermatogenesis- and oogenesis-specific basic helix-loop-helix-containing protein 1 [Hyaena hyaena]|uniref:spermatogenesis- and oogenesis-specific basic helix-loop-helix-containing protein 1 n=1 Tax=Hyaena hyaena TaxID=95912 RepID=UPI0019244A63|nr:spermatogenesis- and oogenesis-specific basic helix-loop-helix-containing protein 1 [Hyaena hyaena]
MASGGAEPGARGCSAQGRREDQAAERAGSGLPRNVLSERERRKRISVSCERLRALLPRFAGRREDMASVLEMSVQFLRLGGGQHQPGALALSKETWHKWQRDILQLALSSPTSAGAPDSGVAVPGATEPQAAPRRATAGVAQAPPGAAAVLDGPPGRPGEQKCRAEPRSLAPWPSDPSPRKALRSPPLWPPHSWQPPSPLGSEEAQSCLGQAGSPMEGAYSVTTPATGSASGDDVEDGTSLLLSTGPDWWLGSLEGRGAGVPTRSAVRSSLLDRAEPSFLADAGPGPQEPLDGPPEPWGPDTGCLGLAPREEVDGIFPDFFAS